MIWHEQGEHHLAAENQAGLARVSLAQGDLSQAQSHVEEILSFLGGPHLETGALEGTGEPFRVYLTCYRVLQAGQDPRAREILTATYNLLQERAAIISNESLRRSFLENVVARREIVAAYQALQAPTKNV